MAMFLGLLSNLIHLVSSCSCSSHLLSSEVILAIFSAIRIPTPPPLLLGLGLSVHRYPFIEIWSPFLALFRWLRRFLCFWFLVRIPGFLSCLSVLWRWLMLLWFHCFFVFWVFSTLVLFRSCYCFVWFLGLQFLGWLMTDSWVSMWFVVRGVGWGLGSVHFSFHYSGRSWVLLVWSLEQVAYQVWLGFPQGRCNAFWQGREAAFWQNL